MANESDKLTITLKEAVDMGENFLPRDGRKRVMLNHDGTVRWFIVTLENRDLFARIVSGFELEIKEHPFSPKIKLELKEGKNLRHQLIAMTNYYAQRADKIRPIATGISKPWWSDDLAKCGIIFLPDGKVGITLRHWHGKAPGDKRVILMKPKTVFKAIEMQDEVRRDYKERLKRENGFDLDVSLTALLNRWHIVEPLIELRHAQLIWTNKHMARAINVAYKMLNKILQKTPATNQERYGELFGDLVRLAYYLENNWANPYAEAVQLCLEEIYKAKRLARKACVKNMTQIQIYLNAARQALYSLNEAIYRDNAVLEKLLIINPVRTLNEIDRRGLTDEVMSQAKRKLPRQDNYRLIELLAIAEQLLGANRSNVPIPVPQTSRPVIFKQRTILLPSADAANIRRQSKKKLPPNFGIQSDLGL